MAELDLSSFLKESSVADLDWLDVDEVAYRKQDHLPKQNLDIKPDLEALWAREGESPTTYLVPNVVPVPNVGIDDPHTMGDMSQMHGKLRNQAEEIAKVARLAMMQSDDLGRLRGELTKRYPLDTLRQHREVLASVLKERGLVGRFYVVAEDFAGVDPAKATAFINKYAPTSRYVLSKKACGGCPHCNTTQPCGQFNRELVTEVPYTAKMASTIERLQAARGRIIKASAESEPKERIRAAYLAPTPERSEQYAGQGVNQQATVTLDPAAAKEQLISAASLTRKKEASENASIAARPIIAFLHREMVKGLTQKELASNLKIAFDRNLLARTKEHWGPLFKEAGLYGVVYTNQDSFEDCRHGADFLAKHNSQVRAIVAGEKCGGCIYNKTRCLMYGKPLVKNASEVVTNETVASVLQEHQMAGRLSTGIMKAASNWGETPETALKAIHEAVKQATVPQMAPSRMDVQKGFYGNPTSDYNMSGLTRREIVKTAARYMNEGLYGEDLMAVLKSQFEIRDLVAAKADLKVVLAEQGLQGIYYVDPTVYEDYGKGCDEASRLHGSRLVEYVKTGSKCGSCVHQINSGFCSKINKRLANEPPYANKKAQQQEVLASGRSTEITYASLVNNGTSMIHEFQMQNEMSVDVNAPAEVRDVTVMFGTGKVKL